MLPRGRENSRGVAGIPERQGTFWLDAGQDPNSSSSSRNPRGHGAPQRSKATWMGAQGRTGTSKALAAARSWPGQDSRFWTRPIWVQCASSS